MEQKKSTQKRQQLLAAALDVFSVYGFSGASLDEIAQRAEMHKSNIFYYYENKEALYVEVLTTVMQKWLAPLQVLEADLEPAQAITQYLMQKSRFLVLSLKRQNCSHWKLSKVHHIFYQFLKVLYVSCLNVNLK